MTTTTGYILAMGRMHFSMTSLKSLTEILIAVINSTAFSVILKLSSQFNVFDQMSEEVH